MEICDSLLIAQNCMVGYITAIGYEIIAVENP